MYSLLTVRTLLNCSPAYVRTLLNCSPAYIRTLLNCSPAYYALYPVNCLCTGTPTTLLYLHTGAPETIRSCVCTHFSFTTPAYLRA